MKEIYLYNTLSRQKEKFASIETGKVRMYSCGPTVYHFQHIGNMRAFLFADILRRTLEFHEYKVKHIMNITDVGHLTGENEGDADFGEDKMEKGARREGKTVWEIAQMYTKVFFQDLKKLHILPSKKYTRATDHITEQIKMIERLVVNGYAYETQKAVYFDVTKVVDYTILSGQKLEEKRVAVREEVQQDNKKYHPQDFALWFKRVGKFKNHTMHWNSPWGDGFPGWHIECSAMSIKYLGDKIDIHTGGEDHIAVHHTNERAQNIGATGKPVVRVWMHNGFLLVDGQKMSKSLGNVYTLLEIEQRGFEPLAFRYFVLGAHYKTKLNFTWKALEASEIALKKLYQIFLSYPKEESEPSKKYAQAFGDALRDDLNTPKALAILWGIMKDNSIPLCVKRATLLLFDQVLAIGLSQKKNVKSQKIPNEILILLQQREVAREKKDFILADTLRKQIFLEGYEIHDTPNGPKAIVSI